MRTIIVLVAAIAPATPAVGGIVGHELGKGKAAPTAAGAVAGALVAQQMATGTGHTVRQRRCVPVTVYHTRRRVVGYRVTYELDGETYKTRTAEEPGDLIAVRLYHEIDQ